MTSQQLPPPSIDPADYNTLLGTLRIVLRKHLMSTDDMLPAQIIAYNRTTNRAQVQPLIPVVTTLGVAVTRAQVMSVPVQIPGGGAALQSFNLVKGDLGWIKSNDRDISLFKQSYNQQPPNTKRLHSFEDAIFIPDLMTGYTIVAEDAGNAVFQTKDGTVCLALWPTQFKQTAPNSCITDTKAYAPQTNCVLDVQSTTKAFKVPRMLTAERDAIPSPIGGMIVYLTDFTPNPKFSFYTDGLGWS